MEAKSGPHRNNLDVCYRLRRHIRPFPADGARSRRPQGRFPRAANRVNMVKMVPRRPQPGQPMSQRLSLSAIIIFLLAALASLYFAFAAVQGPSGLMRRIQLQAETEQLRADRDALQAEVDRMKNLTHRLSDDYLDIDLLDERAREVLGLMRPDEVIIR